MAINEVMILNVANDEYFLNSVIYWSFVAVDLQYRLPFEFVLSMGNKKNVLQNSMLQKKCPLQYKNEVLHSKKLIDH